MEASTRVTSATIRSIPEVFIDGRMEEPMKATGKMGRCMGMGYSNGLTGIDMKAGMKMEKNKARVNSSGEMAEYTTGNGIMV